MRLKDMGVLLIIAVVLATSVLMFLYPGSLTGRVVWMEQGDELKVLDSSTGIVRDVQFYDVAGENRTPICGFTVDGQHIWIQEGKDNELLGVKIYVRKVVLVRDQLQDKDVCKVAFANVLIIENGTQAEDALEDNESLEEGMGEEIPAEIILGEPLHVQEGNISMEGSGAMPEETAPAVEERPAGTGLLSGIIGWIKNLFLSLNVPSR